jgi:ABC-type uncharacterized transport system substrate-binding protein
MWLVGKRLALGIVLITVISAALLLSDRGSRTAAKSAPGTLGRKWNLDLLEYIQVLDVEEAERGIRAGLAEAGLVEGRDHELRVRNAQGDMPTLNTLVDAALGSGTDLLLTLSTPTLQAALRRAGDVPVVFTFVADAIAAGAGRSNEDHLANVTGVPTVAAHDEMIDLVREVLPQARRIGTLFAPAEVNSVVNKELMVKAATRQNLEVVALPVNTSTEIPDATLALLAERIDLICQGGSNLTAAAFASITRPATRVRVPVFGYLTSDFGNGAVVVLARDYYDGGREAGSMAARIIRGERPAAIPFKPLRTMQLLVNLEVAREIGLTIPPPLVARATRAIGG